MAIFAKEAYAAGVRSSTLLALRFALAAIAFWAIVVAARGAAPGPAAPLVGGLALGAFGYAAQAGASSARWSAWTPSLTSLLLYLYPLLVFVGAVALGRERASRRGARRARPRAARAPCSSSLGGGVGALDGLGVALASARPSSTRPTS